MPTEASRAALHSRLHQHLSIWSRKGSCCCCCWEVLAPHSLLLFPLMPASLSPCWLRRVREPAAAD